MPQSVYQIFQLLGRGWEYFRCWDPISLMIPAAIMNAFDMQSNEFISTVVISETQVQLQLPTVSKQHPKPSGRCADQAHPSTSVL